MAWKVFHSRDEFLCIEQWPVSSSWAEAIEKPLVIVLKECALLTVCGGDECRGRLWHKVCLEQPAWQCLDLIGSSWRPSAGTAGAPMAVVQLWPCPRPARDPWVPFSTRSKLLAAWGTLVKDDPIHSDGRPPGATSWFALLTRTCYTLMGWWVAGHLSNYCVHSFKAKYWF